MGNDVVIGEEVCGFEGVKLRFGLSLSLSLGKRDWQREKD